MALGDDEIPRLRMAPRGSAEDLAHRISREQRASQVQRESGLQEPLAPYRVGSVPYLNSVPLNRGLEDQLVFAPPAQLAQLLLKGELDAALLSITEVLLTDRYDILDGIAIASLGEVKSVFLAHRKPIAEAREILCDPASLTSVSLLRVLLAEQGLKPEFKLLEDYKQARDADFVLLIGNPAIDFLRSNPPHEIWDLGAAWYERFDLPFVYAVWAIRRGIDSTRLCRILRDARDFGMDTLDYLITSRSDYDLDFRKDYLGWHIHYHLGNDERRGIQQFIDLLQKHGLGPVHPPRYIS